MFLPRHVGNMVYDSHNLLNLLAIVLVLFGIGAARQNIAPDRIHYLNFIVFLHDYFILRNIIRAAIRGLSQREILVVAYLKIETTCIPQFSGFGAFEHLKAVSPVLYAQTYAELRITPDLVVYYAGGLLRRQNQMYAQTAPYPGRAD